MTTYSVADAKNKLSELIDRAEKGEDVVITRHGRPVIKFSAIADSPRAITGAVLDRLKARRGKNGRLGAEDAGALVSRTRDEDWH
ncbi:MAG: type II toxin-antitoxin system prevent-host-death family antitoxin [Rhizomicrobium sp.]